MNRTAANANLDEASDLPERGPMRLLSDGIDLRRARLFFCEAPYPRKLADAK